jgi:hypothetical protein
LRGLKHTKFGFKLVGNGRVVAQSPANLKLMLLFEGKDNWQTYNHLLKPFFPVMDQLRDAGIQVANTKYGVKQTFGADYVLMAEVMGHSDASATNVREAHLLEKHCIGCLNEIQICSARFSLMPAASFRFSTFPS